MDTLEASAIWTRENAGDGALAAFRTMKGAPYIFGGTWPSSGGTDCSGGVQYSYGRVGVALARTTYEQCKQFPIPKSAKNEVGDLLFYPGSDPEGDLPGHVVMFVADGVVFEAPHTGAKIGQYPYDTDGWDYRTRPALALPALIVPKKKPTPAQLAKAGLVVLDNPTQARLALKNGWHLYVWNGRAFIGTPVPAPKGTPQYASKKFRTPR